MPQPHIPPGDTSFLKSATAEHNVLTTDYPSEILTPNPYEVPPLENPYPVTMDDIHNSKHLSVVVPSSYPISDTGATVDSIPFTLIDGEMYPCRFKRPCRCPKVKMNVALTVSNLDLIGLVDCGADFSAVDAKKLDALQLAIHKVTPIPSFTINLSVKDSPRLIVD